MFFIVTGESQSRLDEVKKYAITGSLSTLFFTANTPTVNGVDPNLTVTGVTASTYTYYIGGITYTDEVIFTAVTTTFSFQSLSIFDPNNFDYLPLVKYETKQNLVENSQVSSDVFIVRQQQPVFERNYRLRALNALNDALTYAGGNYFTIYNNT